MNELTRLWARRAGAFWREAVVYGSYAARSGLTSLLMLGVIIGAYAYGRALQHVPDGYPYWRITTPLLAVVVALSPFRTFLKAADQVFLMPAETKLTAYWRRSGLYSYLFQALWSLGALLLVWPLYVRCTGDGAAPFWAVAASLLFVKAASLDARVAQSRLLYRSHRVPLSLMRWVAAVVFGFMVLSEDYFAGALVFYGFYLLHALAVRFLPRHRTPWEAWIRTEERHLKVHYTIFSWFADVPNLPARPKARRWLAEWAGRLPFDKRETYRYLYAKTFLRSDLAGMAGRILAVAVILFLLVDHAVAEPLIYAATLLMTCATVSSLDRMHRYSFWPELYPVPRSLRPDAIRSTAWRALVLWNAAAGAAFTIWSPNHLGALGGVALGYLFILYYVNVPLRKRLSKEEDD